MSHHPLARAFALICLTAAVQPATSFAQPFVHAARGACFPRLGCSPAESLINAATGHQLKSASMPGNLSNALPAGIVVSPDGTRTYMTVRYGFGPSGPEDSLVVVDTSTYTIVARVSLASTSPGVPVLSPDGSKLFVPQRVGSVAVIDTTALTVTATVTVGGTPQALALSPSTNRLYVADSLGGVIVVIDTTSMTVAGNFVAGSGATPTDLAITPDGATLFVAAYDNAVTAVSLPSTTVRFTMDVSGLPVRVRLGPGGAPLYVAVGTNTTGLARFDAATGEATGFTPLAVPLSLAVSPDGTQVAVGSFDAVLIIATSSMTVTAADARGTQSARDLVFAPQTACFFEATPRRLQFRPQGDTQTLTIPIAAGCPWTATVFGSQFSLTSATSGIGPGTIRISSAQTETGAAGAVQVNGQNTSLGVSVPHLYIDSPADGATLTQPFDLSGWAFADDPDPTLPASPHVDAVQVWAFPVFPSSGPAVFVGSADIGLFRPDVAAAFSYPLASTSGWRLNVRSLPAGRYQFAVYMHSVNSGFDGVMRRTYTVNAVAGPQTRIVLDSLANGDTVTSPFLVSGWAMDAAASSGTGVDTVHVWAYPADGTAPRFLGVPNYGTQRTDIGKLFGSAFAPSGFALAGRLAPGAYTVVTFAHSTLTNTFTAVATAAITVSGAAQPIVIFTPGNRLGATAESGTAFSLSIAAIDERASTGTGVDVVHLWAYPVGGGSPVFLGSNGPPAANAVMGAAFGQQFLNSQFTILNFLPPAGTYDLVFFARSTVTGQFDIVRVKRYVSP